MLHVQAGFDAVDVVVDVDVVDVVGVLDVDGLGVVNVGDCNAIDVVGVVDVGVVVGVVDVDGPGFISTSPDRSSRSASHVGNAHDWQTENTD